MMTEIEFDTRFFALTGYSPMRWQWRLFRDYFADGRLPSAVDIPTGLGKTAVMAIWMIALAQQTKSDQVSLPRRLVYVVDRRAVVDQATQFAEDLRANLQKPEARELHGALGLNEAEALPISTLRGQFVDNREWLEDPSRPAIIVGTVDMIGSRLLFEGYGVSRKMRPYQAGLLGADTLVLLDEAHLVPPFEVLLAEIAGNAGRYGEKVEAGNVLVPKFQLLPLSATGRRKTAQPFALEEKDFRNPDDDIVLQRLFAKKRLNVQESGDQKLEDVLAEQAWRLAQKTQAPNDGGENTEITFRPVRVIVYCNSRDVAEKVKSALDKKAKKTVAEGRTELFVGARRVKERTDAENRLRELGFIAGSGAQTAPAFLVATSAGEVGIDLDADHMVCDLVAWERMVQRFGRVNRRGDEGRQADIVVIDEGEPKPKKQNAPTADEQTSIRIYQGVKKLFEELHTDGDVTISVSPESLRQLSVRASADEKLAKLIADAGSPVPLRPALNRPLVDAWSMTSLPEHTGRPEVAPWLHGWVDELPQTTVALRKHLPVRAKPQVTKREIEDFFEAAPIHVSETLETETFRVMKWLKARAGKLDAQVQDRVCGILLTTDGKHVQTLYVKDLLGDSKGDKKCYEEIEKSLRGKTLVMPASFGGLKSGLLNIDEKNDWLSPDKDKMQLPETADGDVPWMNADAATPVIRFRVIERDTEPDQNDDDGWRESLRFDLERSTDGEVTRWLSVHKWRDTSNTENDRAEGRPQALTEHQCWAAERAQAIGERLGLPKEYISMLATAARLHDEGKRASNWQRAFNAERDKKKYGIADALAKTRGPINQAVLGGYRHEFGSLPYAKGDAEFRKLSEELQDLALHLIAAHHGFARPLIATTGCAAPPSVLEERAREVALRYAHLQKRWGPWGLAWWEALLRAADAQASRDNDNKEKN
ncbi:type I-G CRISPR-associated helicase/endonuclease Cas3g [Zobellella sp. An-6]|uniref:type I-G CRISPR-associated helicase/endonuclease Cas3g n=1 Tax=Zobellella sp. An-6 TaxID=3400218 RepID=UPI004041EF72